jgi:CO/xanthine dehydrogenase FAD-binding subunit
VATVVAYHRPTSLEEALVLLARPGTAVRAGGRPPGVEAPGATVELVDLQALGLHGIEELPAGRLRLGGQATLEAIAGDERVPALLRLLAQREEPSSLRTLTTVAAVVAGADPESELLAGLLAHDAEVDLARPEGVTTAPLASVLDPARRSGAEVLLALTVDRTGRSAVSRTGRTPADRSIVAAVARRPDGGAVRLALTGVAPTPVLLDGVAALDALAPPGDFRGTAPYRAHLARVHAARVLEEVG